MSFWRTGFAIAATATALSACAPQVSPPPAPPAASPAAPSVSFDGTYTGTVSLQGVGAGVPPQACRASPAITLQVTNNAFVYSQPHPGAGAVDRSASTATYSVSIAPDGSFSGMSQVSGTMTGRIVGGTMTGTIDGIECVYGFTATRG